MSCVCMMSCVWFMFSHSHSHLMFTPHSGGSTYAAHQPPGWGGRCSTPTTRLVDAVCGVWLVSFCFENVLFHVHIHIHTWCAHRTHIIPLNYWGLWWLWVVCCGVLGCFVACSHTFTRRFTAHISHACAIAYPGAEPLHEPSSGVQAWLHSSPRRSSSAWACAARDEQRARTTVQRNGRPPGPPSLPRCPGITL